MMTTTSGVQPVSPASSVHLDHLDGLRCIACLCVMLTHTFAIAYTPFLPAMTQWAMFARFSVDLFIVLSGYCLMFPVLRRNGELRGGALEFYKRRARRILPPYYVALGLSLFLIWALIGQPTGNCWDAALPVTARNLTAHLLLIQNVYGGSKINAPLWTVSVEWWIYFLFPVLVFFWRSLGATVMTMSTIVLSYFCYFALAHTKLSGLTCHYVGLFTLGMLSAAVSQGQGPKWLPAKESRHWLLLAIVPIAVNIALRLRYGQVWANNNLGLVDFISGIGSACLLVVVAQNLHAPSRILREALSRRPLVALGKFAYSVYLIHFPLLQVIWQYGISHLHVGKPIALAALVVIGCPVTVGLCYLFHLVFELPFMANFRNEKPVQVAPGAVLVPTSH